MQSQIKLLNIIGYMNELITNIVFTKNRPLQLDAYLESLYRYFPVEKIKTHIIYKPELFSEEYESLFKKYPDCVITRENDFHTDCLSVINQADTKYILFGIDDVVFFDSVGLDLIDQTFDEHQKDILGFTLRFSPESLKNSKDVINEFTVNNRKIYCLNWKNGQTPHSRYPFELCCTIYRTELVKRIISGTMNNNPIIKKIFLPDTALIKGLQATKFARKILKSFGYFFSPNTLESWNCHWCQNHKDQLPSFLYFQKNCAAAIQVNMVNTTTKDSFNGSGDYAVEALNNKYKQGYRLDIDYVARSKPINTHCDKGTFKITQNVK